MSDYNIDPGPVERAWKEGGRLEGVEECVRRKRERQEKRDIRADAPRRSLGVETTSLYDHRI